MLPLDLIRSANEMIAANRGKPSQVSLRRATSSAYYAMFHCLARCCADLLIGGTNSDRSKPAWRQTYRALEYGTAKTACRDGDIKKFPKEIEDFANQFVILQEARHKADYDPLERFYKSSVQADVRLAEETIKAFQNSSTKDRRAFAAFVLFRKSRR